MNNNIANFKEEFSSKIPALTLLSTLGYQFISPSQCEKYRGNSGSLLQDKKPSSQVMLLPIIREFLSKQTFPFAGKNHPLSSAAIDKILHTHKLTALSKPEHKLSKKSRFGQKTCES